MTYLFNAITEPRFFMWLITVLFALSAIRQAFAQDFWGFVYSAGASVINLAVIMKG